jgi:hypothetical protein
VGATGIEPVTPSMSRKVLVLPSAIVAGPAPTRGQNSRPINSRRTK